MKDCFEHIRRIAQRAIVCLLVLAIWAAGPVARADLRTPAWFDTNAVGNAPDWHYRLPIQVPAGTPVNSTIRVDVDFAQALTNLGVAGNLAVNSPRVVRPNNSLSATQQFTDRVYGGSTDAAGNGRGEVRFILEDAGPATYYIYFDISANGAKSAWPAASTINGNFEFSTDTQQDPPGWNGRTWSAYDAMAIIDEPNRTVTTDAGNPSSVTTNETADSGQFCYLIGARNANEARNRNPSARLERTFTVPAGSPGSLSLRYRVKGWDSAANGSTNWDFIRIELRRGNTVVANLVGPAANNYTSLPFSPNYGTQSATGSRSGYGQYNGWDTDTGGTHHSGMTLAPGSEPWFTVTANLAAWAGQALTLRIETRNSTLYKSWYHIDNVQWSVTAVAPGNAEAFGCNITAPNDTATTSASVYNDGDTIVLAAILDAQASSVTADLVNPAGTTVAGGIVLFDDGTHGDVTAGDGIWTNDGSNGASPTYTFPITAMAGTAWYAEVSATDGSAGVVSTDQQVFTVITPPDVVLVKTVAVSSDPVNGSTNAKAIPGAMMLYTITATNQGGGTTDGNSIMVTDPVPANTALFVGDLNGPASGPVRFVDGSPTSGLTYTFTTLNDGGDDIAFSNNGGASFVYTPVPDGNGCDDQVTHIRINPKGTFNGTGAGGSPAFSLRFAVRVQ